VPEGLDLSLGDVGNEVKEAILATRHLDGDLQGAFQKPLVVEERVLDEEADQELGPLVPAGSGPGRAPEGLLGSALRSLLAGGGFSGWFPGHGSLPRDIIAMGLKRELPILNPSIRISLHPAGHPQTRVGRKNKKWAPFPSALSTQMRPPCASTMRRQMVRPSPVPSTILVSALSIW